MSVSQNKIEALESLPVRYRPKTINDMVGNTRNKNLLLGYINKRQIVRTWLMSGSPGSGKTSVARIFAMIVNCQDLQGADPCMTCDSCKMFLKNSHPDFHEYNLAGEDGKVETTRQIFNISNMMPRFNYRVFLLDEIQGATAGTKKEILKTLEEPPAKTIWILCTMNPEKLSQAIHSRCTSLYWTYPTINEISKHIYNIAKKEFDPDIVKSVKPYIKQIANSANRQPRQSIQNLEQVCISLLSNPDADTETINKIIESCVFDTGTLDNYVIRFITYIFLNKKFEPLRTIREIDSLRLGEFIEQVFRFSYYAAVFFLNQKKSGPDKISKYEFYGIDFIRYENALKQIANKVDETHAFRLCESTTIATEKLRLGLLNPEQAALLVFSGYFK